MKRKPTNQPDPDLLPEYDFSKGVRGKYAARYAKGSNVVVIAPDLAAIFPDSASVNEALRSLVKLARKSTRKAS
jgi:hypothetical protein